jgi:hypothetical protein
VTFSCPDLCKPKESSHYSWHREDVTVLSAGNNSLATDTLFNLNRLCWINRYLDACRGDRNDKDMLPGLFESISSIDLSKRYYRQMRKVKETGVWTPRSTLRLLKATSVECFESLDKSIIMLTWCNTSLRNILNAKHHGAPPAKALVRSHSPLRFVHVRL